MRGQEKGRGKGTRGNRSGKQKSWDKNFSAFFFSDMGMDKVVLITERAKWIGRGQREGHSCKKCQIILKRHFFCILSLFACRIIDILNINALHSTHPSLCLSITEISWFE